LKGGAVIEAIADDSALQAYARKLGALAEHEYLES
jgi:hypothetical protein